MIYEGKEYGCWYIPKMMVNSVELHFAARMFDDSVVEQGFVEEMKAILPCII
jgi:hypothetical protein